MQWEECKKTVTSLTEERKEWIKFLSGLVSEREQQGLTQRDMANATGLEQSAIARFESLRGDDSIPSMKTVLKYARALGKELTIK
ncbi:hypothetical protein bcgnr5378_07730 [Bacillus cereus]|uniref:HTH cro/C1-type domain-containing protein n=1 Tax=Bacillus cereus TaxID=1396 RepID=A0A162P3P3_BACCE|nr:helix-turn-helix transcriptional regulator [Bacillus cereus]KZD66021.1 hypothetical protein B4088_2778 [Bacillus cereus]